MLADTLLDLLHQAPEYQSLLEGLRWKRREQMVYGLSGSMKTFLAAGLRRETGRPLLIITSTLQQAERIREDLSTWLPGQTPLLFPPMEHLPYDVMAHSPEVAGQRLGVLERLTTGQDAVVVAPVGALLRALIPQAVFGRHVLTVNVGKPMDLEQVVRHLAMVGYERVEMVEGRGQFARRGDILDVWPLPLDAPVRIESDWDEVTRIRRFDPSTQRSAQDLSGVSLPPAREFVLPPHTGEAVAQIRADLQQAVQRLQKANRRPRGEERTPAHGDEPGGAANRLAELYYDGPTAVDRLQERVMGHLERLENGLWFEGIDQYLPYFYPESATLMDYFARSPIVLVDEPARLREAAQEVETRERERQFNYVERGGLLTGQFGLYLNYAEFLNRLRRWQTIYSSLLPRKVQGLEPENVTSVTARPMQEFHGQWPLFHEEIQRWQAMRYRMLVVASTGERRERLRQLMLEAEIIPGIANAEISADGWPALPSPQAGAILLAIGSLESGFIWPGLKLAVTTDAEFFGRVKRRRRVVPHRDGREAARIASLQDLKVGDYVVHVNHGVGKYLGVQSETILGATRDYVVIQYEGTDRLKIPTDQIDQVQKYIGAEGHEPRLNRLGGAEWSKVKSRVKESIREMAAELLRVQAMREALPGFAAPPDSPWQKEFEDAFPYEETPDQLQATDEIKADLEKSRPMDRLLLGDVGYGKTEVGLRAAFKTVTAGKQVAILVPTTILAQQHFATCKQRFAGFPIEIAVLNRFRTPREQNQVLQRVARGEVDILIGTHRILGDDVRFKDLGLLIVDEEQRFGVQHKEKLKALRATIDVLTLSATPIPRTLHMAMASMRDISVITTPPEDRFPVETFVAEYDEELVRDSILRELRRGGQVYYVHNRVQTIEQVAGKLQQLVPDCRIAVAHGQMKEDRLEQTMLDFLEGEYDMLVATTIIENGLDIPRVNTLICDEADHLGLAQLYQLRGRVGRSNRLAYAYFLYRRDKVLTEQAEKRLQAIKDFTELGSGFKIAMRDLEIRGAGNILGPEQHGFVVSVGFDLYCQLLEETMRELKGEAPPPPEFKPTVELTVDAYIPDTYIFDPRQKIDAYKRVTAIRSETDIQDVTDELVDRYGELPDAVKNLLTIARIKILAAEHGVASVNQIRDRVYIKLLGEQRPAADLISDLNRRYRGRVSFNLRPPSLTLRVQGWTPADLILAVEDILKSFHTLSVV